MAQVLARPLVQSPILLKTNKHQQTLAKKIATLKGKTKVNFSYIGYSNDVS
jgi:hypothetical protein